MDTPALGHYWKTPFIWEPGDPLPRAKGRLYFEVAPEPWLRQSISAAMSNSLDESDQHLTAKLGTDRAVDEVYQVAKEEYFQSRVEWWHAAIDTQDRPVAFVLSTLFADPSRFKDGKPQGTILYMGVLPQHRGHGYAQELIEQATRLCVQEDCWRIFCDTGSHNSPMLKAFRKSGYRERKPWQRPLE